MPRPGSRKSRESDIDAHLKRAFQSLSDEAIPDRLASLLEQLRSGEGGADPKKTEAGTPATSDDGKAE